MRLRGSGYRLPSLGRVQAIPLGARARAGLSLDLIESMSKLLPFHDQELLRLLRCGVPTGALSVLPTSHQWAPVLDAEPDTSLDLALCQGNWKQAEEHPEVVQRLIDQEVEAGWVVRTSHTPGSAKQAWPAGVAVGKLNVAFVEGKEPRLVLDSSIY